MIAQMKRIAPIAPNVFVKLPATKAGIEAVEEGVALGFNVAATLSFSVPQVVAVAKAQQRGEARARRNNAGPGTSVAVLMVGRLDDYIRDVVCDNGLGITESEIRQCGIACIKRAYSIFNERGYKTLLMVAAARGTYHITELAGANMILSIAPQIENLLLKENPEKSERIENPVPKKVIEKLLSVREFAKAYFEDGMELEDFITYGPTNRTLVQFVESGWNRLMNF
jgi:transaldolase